jgi:hypothetical protein
MDQMEQNPQSGAAYVGVDIALAAGIGAALGVAMDNIALGMGLGTAICLALGAALTQANKPRNQ